MMTGKWITGIAAAGAMLFSAALVQTVPAQVTVTDMMGREISIEEDVERVVALTAADCEILYALGAGDMLVGRGEYCDYPAEVFDVPSVQSGYDTNIEQIIELKPQVLLMGTMAQSEEQIEQLENAGVHVVVSDAQNIDGVYTAIEMIAELTGKEEEAKVLVEDMKQVAAFKQLVMNYVKMKKIAAK